MMSNTAPTSPTEPVGSTTCDQPAFWLTDPETRTRVRAAVEELICVAYWAVQDNVTFVEAIGSLAASTCDGFDLDRSFVPLVQARAAAVGATWSAEFGETVDPLGDDFLACLAAFQRYLVAVQAALLDTYEDHWAEDESTEPKADG